MGLDQKTLIDLVDEEFVKEIIADFSKKINGEILLLSTLRSLAIVKIGVLIDIIFFAMKYIINNIFINQKLNLYFNYY